MFIVHLKDGRTLKEGKVNWKDVPVQNISSLQIYRNGKYYTISVDGKNVNYIQVKRNTLDVLTGVDMLTERVIGFTVDNLAFKLEVDEKTGNCKVTVDRLKDRKWKRL